MTFQEKIKTTFYWQQTLRLAFLLFVLLTIFSLLFTSFSDILNFDLDAVKSKNFGDGKWKRFLMTKGMISILYSMFIISRKMK